MYDYIKMKGIYVQIIDKNTLKMQIQTRERNIQTKNKHNIKGLDKSINFRA